MNPTTKKGSRRGRNGEGRPSKRSPAIVTLISEAIADGLTDEEAAAIADIDPDTLTQWRKVPEFSGAIKKATAIRLRKRLARIEAGEPGWQGVAWALERIYPTRFARPEVLNQIAVLPGQPGAPGAQEVRVITIPDDEWETLATTPGYAVRADGDLERREGNLLIVLVRQSGAGRLIREKPL